MSKNRGYREHSMSINEAMPVEVKNEVVENPTEETATVEKKMTIGVVTDCIKLNIRKEPTIESESLRVISVKDKVHILDEKTTNDWVAVQLDDGTKGYTMSKYIKAIN